MSSSLAVGKAVCTALVMGCIGAGAANFKPAGQSCWVYDYDLANAGNPETSYEWSGPCVDGLASGHGELRAYLDGRLDETTQGEMVKGRLEGRAMTALDGAWHYEGLYANGRRNGPGRDWDATGNYYEGNYADGRRQGYGKATFANGLRYVGQWADDRPSGAGTVILPNGDHFEGSFSDGHYAGLLFKQGGEVRFVTFTRPVSP